METLETSELELTVTHVLKCRTRCPTQLYLGSYIVDESAIQV